jgi:hypothetical protein
VKQALVTAAKSLMQWTKRCAVPGETSENENFREKERNKKNRAAERQEVCLFSPGTPGTAAQIGRG